MNTNTPVIFSDGTTFFEELSKTYIRHDRGFFILAPSGSGKTYFVKAQTKMDWMDGDTLWPAANADKTSDEWNPSLQEVYDVNNKCDIITNEAKKLGFWIIGSSNHFLRPDAIVLPDWETHEKYIMQRENTTYDGGAKIENLDGVKAHRAWIQKWEIAGVPCFTSVDLAVEHITNSHNSSVRS